MSSRWEVDLELVEAWLLDLDQRSYELVIAAVELLGEIGPRLGKAGNWKNWYAQNIPIADDRFDDHVARLRGQG